VIDAVIEPEVLGFLDSFDLIVFQLIRDKRAGTSKFFFETQEAVGINKIEEWSRDPGDPQLAGIITYSTVVGNYTGWL
jgi:hypothetical protein